MKLNNIHSFGEEFVSAIRSLDEESQQIGIVQKCAKI